MALATYSRPPEPPDRPPDVGGSRLIAGSAPWLGKGFGMAVAKQKYRECLFGARMQFAPTLTRDAVRTEIGKLEDLVLSMVRAAGLDIAVQEATASFQSRQRC